MRDKRDAENTAERELEVWVSFKRLYISICITIHFSYCSLARCRENYRIRPDAMMQRNDKLNFNN